MTTRCFFPRTGVLWLRSDGPFRAHNLSLEQDSRLGWPGPQVPLAQRPTHMQTAAVSTGLPHPHHHVSQGPPSSTVEKHNKTRTSKVGAISKTQKAQNIFFGKTSNFWKFSFDKCRIVPKNVKVGTLWDLLAYIQFQNIKKIEGGTFWGH